MNDLATLSATLGSRMAELAQALTGEAPTQRARDCWRWRHKGSLAVEVSGPKRGLWHDHEAGQGGDALALIAHLRRTGLREAIQWGRTWLGDDAAPVTPAPAPRPSTPAVAASRPMALRLWQEARPAAGTPVETYLRGRGLILEDAAPIRFHPSCPRGDERLPAMVALMTDPATGEPCGLHRTYLLPDGSDRLRDAKGKAMLGNAGMIRLTPDDEITAGLGMAEGIETALAVMQGFGWRPVWAATSAGAMARFPILPGIEALTVFADADGAGLEAAQTCIARWSDAGREAQLQAPPRGDFNDLAREAA
jgi:putative DNA primase/helicase